MRQGWFLIIFRSCIQVSTTLVCMVKAKFSSERPIPSFMFTQIFFEIIKSDCYKFQSRVLSSITCLRVFCFRDAYSLAKSPRTLKGAIEFLWIGGQQLDLTLNTHPDPELEAFPGLPERELMSWKNNAFWSFDQFEHMNKPLVIWDVVAAFLAFRQSIPPYVEHIFIRWMRTFLDQNLRFHLQSHLKYVNYYQTPHPVSCTCSMSLADVYFLKNSRQSR